MSITELIKHVGEDNLGCQWLSTSLEGASIVSGEGRITFRTGSHKVLDLLKPDPQYRCLIIWIEDKVYPTPEQMAAADAARSATKFTPGKYTSREGNTYIVEAFRMGAAFPLRGYLKEFPDEDIAWKANGKFEGDFTNSPYDLMPPAVPYADAYGVGLPVDTQANQSTKHTP